MKQRNTSERKLLLNKTGLLSILFKEQAVMEETLLVSKQVSKKVNK